MELLDNGNCSITKNSTFYANNPLKLDILDEGEVEAIICEVMKDLIELLKMGELEEQHASRSAFRERKFSNQSRCKP